MAFLCSSREFITILIRSSQGWLFNFIKHPVQQAQAKKLAPGTLITL